MTSPLTPTRTVILVPHPQTDGHLAYCVACLNRRLAEASPRRWPEAR